MRIRTLQKGLLLLLSSWGLVDTSLAQEKHIGQLATDSVRVYKPLSEKSRLQIAASVRQHQQATSQSTTAQRANNACNVVLNGDFEIQSAPPSKTGNIQSPIPTSVSQLPSWFAPNYTSPDYIATNGIVGDGNGGPDMTPAGSMRGPFEPLPGALGGTVGISFTQLIGGSQGYPEYVAQHVGGIQEGVAYYGEFWVRSASYYAHSNKLGMYLTNSDENDLATDYDPTPHQLPLAERGRGFTSGQLTTPNQWVRVSGKFVPADGDNFLTIGYPHPQQDEQRNTFSGPIQASYYYIDDVALYRIPTAGPSKPCVGRPVQLGEGCEIPGATYAWSKSGDPTFSSTSLLITVIPGQTASETYSLTVTLPDGSTHTTSALVAVCPCLPTPPAFGIVEKGPPPVGGVKTYDVAVSNGANAEYFELTLTQPDPPYMVIGGNPQMMYVYTGPGSDAAGNPQVQGFTTFHLGLIGPVPNAGPGVIYRMVVTAVGPCGRTTTIKVIQLPPYTTGGSEDPYRMATQATSAYPNPAVHEITLPTGTTHAQLLNGRGTVVAEQGEGASSTLRVEQLPEGLYQLRMTIDGKPASQRIQVKR